MSDRGRRDRRGDRNSRRGASGNGVSRNRLRRDAGLGRSEILEQRAESDSKMAYESNKGPVVIVLAVLVAIVVIRLFCIQVLSLDKARVLNRGKALAWAETVESYVETVPARRGTIYDRNGNVLAQDQECTEVVCHPNQIPSENVDFLVATLTEYLGGDEESYREMLTQGINYDVIAKYAVRDDAAKVRAAIKDENYKEYEKQQASKDRGDDPVYEAKDYGVGMEFNRSVKRVYPYSAAGQLLGLYRAAWTDENGELHEGEWVGGLEKYYDDVLRGTDGQQRVWYGIGGTPIETEVYSEAVDGQDIVVSIDIHIQEAAEQAITEGVEQYEADSGSVVVTDPKTGEVLALCSTPLLDLTSGAYEEGSDSVKPVSALYEPGSIFKILTSAIGIDNGLVRPDTTYSVPPALRVGDDLVRDDDGRDYTMSMSLREMMRRSSNTGLSLVAQQTIGADKFAEGVAKFGIGTPTGIDLPGEEAGIVTARDDYSGATLGAMAFGQALAIPQMQMVKAVGSIANGGDLVTPHLLISVAGEDQSAKWAAKAKRGIVSKDTCDQVTDMLRTVVQEGTATAAQVPGYDIAGKTGTGEQADEAGGYVAFKYVSSLIGYAPASDPEVLVYVGLNGTPYLATASAAPLFSTIMGTSLTELGVEPTE